MSRRAVRWEVVRTAAGWHARFIAGNGKTIVSSESYKRERGALRCIELVTGMPVQNGLVEGQVWAWCGDDIVEVRTVDER